MSNGRCRLHGGKTPSGDNWHRPVWPEGDAPASEYKLFRKLESLQKAARARASKLRNMSDEDRMRHEAWHKSRPTTSAADRAEIRRLREQAKSARALRLSAAPKEAFSDPDYLAICQRIAELRAKLEELHANHTTAPVSGPVTLTEGVFG